MIRKDNRYNFLKLSVLPFKKPFLLALISFLENESHYFIPFVSGNPIGVLGLNPFRI